MKKLKKKISILLLIVMIITFVGDALGQNEVYGATKKYSNYVYDVKIKESKGNVTVSYKVDNVPNPVVCKIGVEDFSGAVKKEKSVGAEGKHKVTWEVGSPIYRIYTVIYARGYKDKDIIKTFYNVKTGTTYHTVTKGEETANKIGNITVSSAITLSGFFLPETQFIKIGLAVGGISFGTISTFSYNPTEGDYQVIKTSYDPEKENLKVTIKIYKSKASFKNGDKPIVKSTGSKHLGFSNYYK